MNTSLMKSIRFSKFLKDAGLISKNNIYSPQLVHQELENSNRQLSQVECDIIFTKLTSSKFKKLFQEEEEEINNDQYIQSPAMSERHHHPQKINAQKGSKGKLEFEHFLKSLEMICEKLYPEFDLQQSLPYLIDNYLVKIDVSSQKQNLELGSQHVQTLLSILQDQQIIELLQLFHQGIFIFYRFYADQQQSMNIEEFLQFCKDFEIFPYILPKSKLSRIFYTLAGMYERPEQGYQEQQSEEELIDENLFIQALALCALEFYLNENLSSIQKLMLFFEKMNQSNGPAIVQKKLGNIRFPSGETWDILAEIRKNFQVKSTKSSQKQSEDQEDFEEYLRSQIKQNLIPIQDQF